MNRRKMRDMLILGTALIVIYTVAQHTRSILDFILVLLKILEPFVIGAAAAFILNVPMRFFENHLLKSFDKNPKLKGLKRPLALLLVVLVLVLVVYVVMSLLVPELVNTITSIIRALPKAFRQVNDWLKQYGYDLTEYFQTAVVGTDPDQIKNQIDNVLQLALQGAIFSTGVIGSLYSGVLELFFSIMFTIYFLFAKERLARQFIKLGYAYLPEKRVDRLLVIGTRTQKTFSSFITGQCLEAVILGTMFFLTMSLFKMPYVLLISVFIAITALIPVIGAWLGCIVGALLILVSDPMQALGFVVLFLVLQQIEGNLVYPHVMGNAIGLPSIWVLFAVVLGEGLLGIVGMLLFIPLTSVLYSLTREYVSHRLEQRGLAQKAAVAGQGPEPPADGTAAGSAFAAGGASASDGSSAAEDSRGGEKQEQSKSQPSADKTAADGDTADGDSPADQKSKP